MAAENGFKIDGVIYEPADVGSLTMDEWQVMWDYAGISIEDFSGPEVRNPQAPTAEEQAAIEEHEEELGKKLNNPGFMKAMVHIAFQRGNPRMSPDKVKRLIGSAQMVSVIEDLRPPEEQGGDVEGPPAPTSEPERSSPGSSLESKPINEPSSGTPSDPTDGSPMSSGARVVSLEPTTTGASEQSSDVTRSGSVA